jgi:hypothetical protein
MKVSALWHWNALHKWLIRLLNEYGQIMPHLQDADNVNSLANIAGRPVVQSINPNVKIITSERSAKLTRFGNANHSHLLTN